MSKKIIGIIFIILFWITFIVVTILTFLFQILQIDHFRKYFRRGNTLSVIVLEGFPSENAGYEYRSNKWVKILNENGIRSKVFTIFSSKVFYDKFGEAYSMSSFFIIFMWKRLWQCFKAFNYDVVIVRRELLLFNDYGNLFMDKFLQSINSKIILDFDDNISASKHEPRDISLFGKLLLELPDKFKRTLKFYKYFIPGSNYLKQIIEDNNRSSSLPHIFVLPTLVDYNHYEPKAYDVKKETITFGWIGSPTNYLYLPIIINPLNILSEKYNIELVIIGEEPLEYEFKFNMIHYRWSLEKELDLLHRIDVGLMPLKNNEIARGKCGFKLIQYMGCGIVSIASAITVNNDIVDDKINGFLVKDESEWYTVLEEVIYSKKRYSDIGKNAYKKINENFSFDSYKEKYINYLESVKTSR